MDKKEIKKTIMIVLAAVDDEVLDLLSSKLWTLYWNLKHKGFTDDQAISIVSNIAAKGFK